jgi:hypothetical protein
MPRKKKEVDPMPPEMEVIPPNEPESLDAFPETKAVAIAEPQPSEVVASGMSALTPAMLRQHVADETEKREILVEYVSKQLTYGTDYGKIHVNKSCKVWGCKEASHMSKDCLFKPGMEKIYSLMHLTTVSRKRCRYR